MRDLPSWAKLLLGLAVFAVIVVVLFTRVFPYVEHALMNDPVITGTTSS